MYHQRKIWPFSNLWGLESETSHAESPASKAFGFWAWVSTCTSGWLSLCRVVEGNLELLTLPSLLPQCLNYKQVLPCSVYLLLKVEARAVYLLGKHATNWFITWTPRLALKSCKTKPDVGANAFSPSTWGGDGEVSTFLWMQGQLGLQSKPQGSKGFTGRSYNKKVRTYNKRCH